MPGDQSSSPAKALLMGACAGLLSDGIVHPIDTVRVLLQTQRVTQTPSIAHYRSATDAFRQILSTPNGFSRLYQGFGAVAAGTIPGHALYFAAYESMKRYLYQHLNINQQTGQSNNKLHEVVSHMLAGFVADVAGSLIWTPQDVVKQRLQVKYSHRLSSLDCFRSIWQQEGLRGLYRGFGAGLLTYGPYVSIYFALYEQWKSSIRSHEFILMDWRNPYYKEAIVPSPFYWLGAAGSGAISAVITCPLDVIKTRLQVSRRQAVGSYRNAWDAFKRIVKEEGPRALFQGVKPRALWMASGTAITMMIYEKLMHTFG